MIDRFAFIGDIHGDELRLRELLARVDDRHLVFLGDYVDHGPDSKGVVDLLIEVSHREERPIFLMGNHEVGLLAFLAGKLPFLEYAWMGGLFTIRSYIAAAKNDVRKELRAVMPDEHREFLSQCKTFFETDQFVVCHAGLNPDRPLSRDSAEIVHGRHPTLFQANVKFEKLVICGHYLQASQTAFVGDNLVCLNTGCGTINGPLTALLYPEMRFVQTT